MLNDILDILKKELEMELAGVSEEDTLSSVGIDSITFMAMVIYIEQKFDIEFPFDGIFSQEYAGITFQDLINEIQKLTKEKDD